jgi:hypothetical protein
VSEVHGFYPSASPLRLCGGDAVIVAWAGIERLRLKPMDEQVARARRA